MAHAEEQQHPAVIHLLKHHNLPLPETNINVDRRFVDCRWADLNLTVELDSYAFHNTRHAWEQDRRRGAHRVL